jgi:hypothetical protein
MMKNRKMSAILKLKIKTIAQMPLSQGATLNNLRL